MRGEPGPADGSPTAGRRRRDRRRGLPTDGGPADRRHGRDGRRAGGPAGRAAGGRRCPWTCRAPSSTEPRDGRWSTSSRTTCCPGCGPDRGAPAHRGRRLDRGGQVHPGQLAGRPPGDRARGAAARPPARPVLVHHPADAHWFADGRILPGLARTTTATGDPGALQLVADPGVPEGLAVLDAPDIDSVERRNRTLASELLAAADLWLFVTSAARYADQVPWDFLRAAAERSTAVADRAGPDRPRGGRRGQHPPGPDARRPRPARLAPVHRDRGPVERGRPAADAHHVAEIRSWLDLLAADATARAAVVRQTLDGAVRSLAAAHPRGRRRRRGAGHHCGRAARGRRPGLRRGGRAPSTPPPPTAPCCAARCWPAGRSSSAPASCCARWRPGSAGSATGWSAGPAASPSRPSG